ncbi:hypothetical protein QBC47DRAFT_405293 [Echria macrotheca]|uniref:Acid phosphatase-like protein n=1 Tax=Echria macrotheca TaxID=438768 RepID=A0AAJ0B8G3_9PEZI|nr:hypothetical protein QBC47DRAFT_405293 [Echria macrotheca]
MHPAGVAILVIILLVLAGGGGWIIFTRIRAQRLGLPAPPLSSYIPFVKSSSPYGPPQPAPGGVVGWINDRIRAFKNRNNRTAAGAYEGPSGGGPAPGARGARGFGPLDPDEAWDSRVGHEADDPYSGGYYEERVELGLGPGAAKRNNLGTAYENGSSYQMNLATTPGEGDRGRQRSRSPAGNPFADSAEPSNLSMRGVSPRPIETGTGTTGGLGKGKKEDESPTERRSMFRENM